MANSLIHRVTDRVGRIKSAARDGSAQTRHTCVPLIAHHFQFTGGRGSGIHRVCLIRPTDWLANESTSGTGQ